MAHKLYLNFFKRKLFSQFLIGPRCPVEEALTGIHAQKQSYILRTVAVGKVKINCKRQSIPIEVYLSVLVAFFHCWHCGNSEINVKKKENITLEFDEVVFSPLFLSSLGSLFLSD